MTINQISVFVENTYGRLAKITRILADANIDLHAMSIADTQDFGILRIIVNDTETALSTLRENGFTVNITKVIAVAMPDRPGGLAEVLAVLAENKVNVEYLYAFISRKKDNAYVILRVENNDIAIRALDASGIPMVSPEQIYG